MGHGIQLRKLRYIKNLTAKKKLVVLQLVILLLQLLVMFMLNQ